MSDDFDIEGARAALLADRQGDADALDDFVLTLFPIELRELVQQAQARRKRKRDASPRTVSLADAFEHFHSRRGEIGDRAAHVETCAKFQIAKANTLDNVLAKTRQDVNAVLRTRGVLQNH